MMESDIVETMKEHLVNTAVEWLAWSLASHINKTIRKIEKPNHRERVTREEGRVMETRWSR
jgi:hypothetical protein